MFVEDFEIKRNKKGQIEKKDIDEKFKIFCRDYINQIKDKLDFDCKFISILKTDKETQLKRTSSTTLRKKIDPSEKEIKTKVRFEMRMIKPVNRINKKGIKRRPKITRPEQNLEKSRERREKRQVNK